MSASVEGLAVSGLPGGGDAGHGQDGRNVIPLGPAHRLAGFGDSDLHATPAENLLEYLGRRPAAVVHSGAGPVEEDGLQLLRHGAESVVSV